MAKYNASPFGEIRGKVNGQVGTEWKGIRIVKKWTKPSDKGNILQYQKMKDGIITPDKFSYPSFNLRRCIIGPLMNAGRQNFEGFLDLIWGAEARARHLRMSGLNLFIKENATALYASMDKTIEYNPPTNDVDFKVLLMSQGILEGTTDFSCNYNSGLGQLNLTWQNGHWGNGSDTDTVQVIVLAKPLLQSFGRMGSWMPALKLFGPLTPTTGFPPVACTRAVSSGKCMIQPGLTAANLTAFLFFFAVMDYKTVFSKTLSLQVTSS
jgi:hypothetical protein